MDLCVERRASCGGGRGYGQCTQRNGDKVAGQRCEHGDEDDRKVFTYFIFFYFILAALSYEDIVSGSFTCTAIITHTYRSALLLHFRFLLLSFGVAVAVASSASSVSCLPSIQDIPLSDRIPSYSTLILFKQ